MYIKFSIILISLLICALFFYFIVRLDFKHAIRASEEDLQLKVKEAVKVAINEYEWKRDNQ